VRRSKLLLGAAVAAIACASGAAHAARVGVYVGVGGPWYYPVVPAPYYYGYGPAPVVVTPPPDAPDYVEQGQPQGGGPGADYAQGPAAGPGGQSYNGDGGGDTWYYCDASRTYYPYVKQCSSGWRAVPAQQAPGN
jgi:hypothetical protein